ncbi:MAG TPA: glycolate oxidase subunit GlcE [Porticoccaceae bacterium]|nr:glycolate oxidase subunit GlcE [Porticoccaceae bacterium]
MTSIIESWAERIRAAADSRLPLRIRGGDSKGFYGNSCRGGELDTREHSGILAYEPTELVITARCGTALAEIEAALAERNQMLAFEPPHFAPGQATLGGAVAAGLAGPGRLQAGPVRDFVLGAQLLDGRGRVMDFGGQVMKNVAGYDIARLLAGSLGILGVITQLSLKVLPRPMAEATLRLDAGEGEALHLVTRWKGQPLPISATAWLDGQLWVRLSGAAAALDAARRKLGGEAVEEDVARDFWRRLRDQQLPFFAGDAPLWRLSLPANTAPLDLGETVLEWSGGQRWLKADLPAQGIRAAAAELGGSATLFRRVGDEGTATFPSPAPALMQLHRNLKAQFDPAGIFNPGRFYPDL